MSWRAWQMAIIYRAWLSLRLPARARACGVPPPRLRPPPAPYHSRRRSSSGPWGREAHHVAYPVPMILAASMGPMPKISVRVVPEASTSASMRSFRSAIIRSSVRILSAAPPKPTAGGGGSRRRPAAVCRAGCAQPEGPKASRLPRRGRGPAGARGGCFERPGALGHQVLAPLGKES